MQEVPKRALRFKFFLQTHVGIIEAGVCIVCTRRMVQSFCHDSKKVVRGRFRHEVLMWNDRTVDRTRL